MFGDMASEDMLKMYLHDVEIYEHYFKFSLLNKFHSPFRDDPKPSLSFREFSDGSIIWKDFGLMNQKWHDPVGFVAYLDDIEYPNRYEATQKIWKDLVLNREGDFDPKIDYTKTFQRDRIYSLDYEPLKEPGYYGRYGVSTDILYRAGIRKLNTLMYEGEVKEEWCWSEENPVFVYLIDGDDSYKLYRPLDPAGDKFRSENVMSKVEGLDLLDDEGEHLIITKGLKDAAVLKQIGYNACAPTAESAIAGIRQHMWDFTKRFDNIFVLYDNDDPGIKGAKRVVKMFKQVKGRFVMPKEKDPSDYAEKYGLRNLKKVVDGSIAYILDQHDDKSA